MTSLDQLAAQLRSQALSGYSWNVPKRWEDVDEIAKNIWRGKAVRHEIEGLKRETQ